MFWEGIFGHGGEPPLQGQNWKFPPIFVQQKTVFISDLLPVNPRLFPFLLFMMKKFPAQNHFFRLKYQIRSATTSADTAATVM